MKLEKYKSRFNESIEQITNSNLLKKAELNGTKNASLFW